ncbi:MAG: chorismate synthase [Firmicutes bacterium]|nr:chorismate synthase [Bacillota bacterium]
MGSLRFLTAGESHGPALTAIIEGVPAGLTLLAEDINHDLVRRQGGHGRGGRMKIEKDRATILSGVRGGQTLGSPISLLIQNQDWDNWSGVMGAEPETRTDERRLTRPRPGHADLSGSLKYHHQDLRNVLERASARETATRVAVGSVARSLLAVLGVEVTGWVESIGTVRTDSLGYDVEQIGEIGLEKWRHRIESSPVYCPDEKASTEMVETIDAARKDGDTLGGVIVVNAWGLPPGLGSYVHWDRRLDGRLAAAVMSIPAIKGVEIGLGFASASEKGSSAHDEIFYSSSVGIYRQTNRAGGLEGGMTNGQPLVVRVAMKPIPTLMSPLRSVDLETGEEVKAGVERSDVCAVPAASVIAEAAVAFVLAQAVLEKFSGDNLNELMRGWREHWEYVEKKRGL